MSFIALVILIIACLIYGPYNIGKSEYENVRSALKGDEERCQQPNYFRSNLALIGLDIITDQLMLHRYTLY